MSEGVGLSEKKSELKSKCLILVDGVGKDGIMSDCQNAPISDNDD